MFHKTGLQMHWISVRFYEMGVINVKPVCLIYKISEVVLFVSC